MSQRASKRVPSGRVLSINRGLNKMTKTPWKAHRMPFAFAFIDVANEWRCRLKIYVIDSSSLMRDYTILARLHRDSIMIPLVVADELDAAKTRGGEAAWNARKALRYIEEEGLPVAQIEKEKKEDPDAAIIRTAKHVKEQLSNAKVCLLSEDFGMRLRARASGVESESYEDAIGDEHLGGWIQLEVSGKTTLKVYNEGFLSLEVLEAAEGDYASEGDTRRAIEALPVWTGVLLKSYDSSALTVWNGEGLIPARVKGASVNSRGLEQGLAQWGLHSREISLVSLTGEAGTGKSFLSFAAGLDGIQANRFSKLVIVKNFSEVGKGLGFLPGTLEEKLDPWLDSVRDTLKAINGPNGLSYFEMMMKRDKVEVVPMNFIRGRTFDNSFVILDEAQNTTPHEIKTVVTRTGKDSKIVLLGDTHQIDTFGQGRHSCGLSHVIRKFRDSDLAMHVQLSASQRSDLAGTAAKIL